MQFPRFLEQFVQKHTRLLEQFVQTDTRFLEQCVQTRTHPHSSPCQSGVDAIFSAIRRDAPSDVPCTRRALSYAISRSARAA